MVTTKLNEVWSHSVVDGELMEEMWSLWEQYQMEWNNTMNLITTTVWINVLMKMEHDAYEPQNDDSCHVFYES